MKALKREDKESIIFKNQKRITKTFTPPLPPKKKEEKKPPPPKKKTLDHLEITKYTLIQNLKQCVVCVRFKTICPAFISIISVANRMESGFILCGRRYLHKSGLRLFARI